MTQTTQTDDVRIVTFEDEHASAFERLNLEWLEGYGLLEDLDRKYLKNPRKHILDEGGQIFLALDGEEAVATCAVIPCGDRIVELAKLAVTKSARGKGLGRKLTEIAIDFARSVGTRKVVLVSNSKLQTALKLYESMGFRHATPPEPLGYATADVYMELDL